MWGVSLAVGAVALEENGTLQRFPRMWSSLSECFMGIAVAIQKIKTEIELSAVSELSAK